jgi:hypothetical protein
MYHRGEIRFSKVGHRTMVSVDELSRLINGEPTVQACQPSLQVRN